MHYDIESERKKLLSDANLESLDTFFPDLCRDDTEHEKLKRLPGIHPSLSLPLIHTYTPLRAVNE
jgi:hypothetical protein